VWCLAAHSRAHQTRIWRNCRALKDCRGNLSVTGSIPVREIPMCAVAGKSLMPRCALPSASEAYLTQLHPFCHSSCLVIQQRSINRKWLLLMHTNSWKHSWSGWLLGRQDVLDVWIESKMQMETMNSTANLQYLTRPQWEEKEIVTKFDFI
jgi:hypothetical protein